MNVALTRTMVSDVSKLISEYEGKSDQELQQAAQSLVEMTAENFVRLAVIVQVADERGTTDELGLSGSYITTLRRIGRGEVVAEAYARFGGTALEPKLRLLSATQQRKLAAGGTVPVYSFNEGRPEKREVDPLKLTDFERRQVFGPDGIQDAAGQRSYVETQGKQRRRRVKGDVIIDRAGHAIIVKVGDAEVSLAKDDLLDYIKQI